MDCDAYTWREYILHGRILFVFNVMLFQSVINSLHESDAI